MTFSHKSDIIEGVKKTLFISDACYSKGFAGELGDILLAGLIYAIGWVVYHIGAIMDSYNENILEIDKLLSKVVRAVAFFLGLVFVALIVKAVLVFLGVIPAENLLNP